MEIRQEECIICGSAWFSGKYTGARWRNPIYSEWKPTLGRYVCICSECDGKYTKESKDDAVRLAYSKFISQITNFNSEIYNKIQLVNELFAPAIVTKVIPKLDKLLIKINDIEDIQKIEMENGIATINYIWYIYDNSFPKLERFKNFLSEIRDVESLFN